MLVVLVLVVLVVVVGMQAVKVCSPETVGRSAGVSHVQSSQLSANVHEPSPGVALHKQEPRHAPGLLVVVVVVSGSGQPGGAAVYDP